VLCFLIVVGLYQQKKRIMEVTTMNANRAMQGYALANNEGEAFWLLGMLQTIKIGTADTNGGFGLIEVVVPPGLGSPLHVHPEEDEWFYVLEGNLTVYVADTRLDLVAGGFAFGPKGVPHTFIGAGPTPTRMLVGFSPMQFEGFVREVGQPAPLHILPPPHDGPPPAIEKLAPIAKRNGFIILGPPGPPKETNAGWPIHS
jgi:quercetin dioxygenase-like cupin family protein